MKALNITKLTLLFIATLVLVSGCYHRWGRGEGADRVLEHLDSYMADLDLTEKQNMAYQDIRVKLEEDLEKIRQKHEIILNEFEALESNNDADFEEVTLLVKQSSESVPVFVSTLMNYLNEIYAILDPEQKVILKSDVIKTMDHIY